ncbi:ExbD/TolR family protein [Kiritimatiella glycovorans]|uniref:Biopolymer transport protein TolR n=1 Tax=Kiritimatiella glycovorans TaxID=1307763 RepID=A0A0G3EC70_9BACT|nr:biopolymer transporter ExbD [Kiritimatiella glycovorans]AKJ64101.1 Biopolymer transport protein TolR [Kiritimatiella glycovorans]
MDIREMLDEKPELQIAPLIDVVFLLLIYFMVSASLIKQEAELGVTLPGKVEQTEEVEMPDEQVIMINGSGKVLLNNREYGNVDSREMPELVATLGRYRQASEALNTKAFVTVQAADEALHQRVVDVMNACAAAGIKNLTFGIQ